MNYTFLTVLMIYAIILGIPTLILANREGRMRRERRKLKASLPDNAP